MRVGLLTAGVSSSAGGVWLGVERLGSALAGNAVEVELFGLTGASGGVDDREDGTPPLNLHHVIGSPAFGYAPSLVAALDARRLSILHVNGIWMYPSLASLRWSRRGRGRRPYIVSPHGMLDPWAVRNAAWKKRLVGWWFEDAHLAGAACMHALAGAEARAIRSYGLRNPICVIPSGVDLPDDEPRALPAWAAEAGGRRVLLFLGRLHPKKGLLNLIRAWAEVQADRSAVAADWLLVIAGWGQGGHEAKLRRLIDELGAARTIRLVGPQFGDQKTASLAFADAFVLPSFSEGLPIAVLEAWSFGLPVLMTDACNLPEGFAAGAALRTEPDPLPMAEALRSLMAMSEADRHAIGARGRILVQERFAWPEIAKQTSSVYEWLLGGGPPPSCIATDRGRVTLSGNGLSTPAVSIVLPTYRRPQLLRRAVASVHAQTFEDWELIITDDEDPPGEAWAYLQSLAAADARVQIARNPGPHGQSGNVNHGLRLARAAWIKILYDDDVLHPRCLEALLAAVDGDRSIAIATCLADRYREGSATLSDSGGARVRIERLPRTSAQYAMYIQDVDIWIPTQALVNRDCIDQGVFLEDVDGLVSCVDAWWFARLLQHGDLLIVNETLADQYQGEHATVTNSLDDPALDAEFEALRRLMLPLIDPALRPPPIHVANQSVRLIRALHRLSRRKPGDALRLAATAWHPQAWYLAARWLLRRGFPGRFEMVPRQTVQR